MAITEKTCSFPGCNRPHYGKGLCNGHWQQWRNGGPLKEFRKSLEGRLCEFENCYRPANGPRFCQSHGKAFRSGQELKPLRNKQAPYKGIECWIESCHEQAFVGNVCKGHRHLNKFHLTYETINRLYANPICAICGRLDNGTRKFHIDHDHAHCKEGCNECVRSLLCYGCNHGLGNFTDDISKLNRAIDYLKKWNHA